MAVLLHTGFEAPLQEKVEVPCHEFPLKNARIHQISQRSDCFAHLNLFGPARHEDTQLYEEREDRQRIFQKSFRGSLEFGLADTKQAGGEIGRAAARVQDVINEGMSDFEETCGKGTPRRKQKKVHKSSGTDDKKLQASLKKLNVQPIQAIEEVNMFKEDGNVIHFAAPKVHAAVPSNTFAVYGNGEDKELTELVPGILNQLGPDSLASLRKLAESYQNLQKKEGGDENKDDDDDIPDLVAGENFESKVE
ncbi:MAG: hypothetical protein Q9219_006783 [cf. Caloplaca sp. 3 TL-2023]